MTLGADAAPADARAEFLGAFRLCHDLGMLAGPPVIAVVSAAAGLGAAAVAIGGISGLGAGGMARWLRPRPAAQSSDSVPDSARPSVKYGRERLSNMVERRADRHVHVEVLVGAEPAAEQHVARSRSPCGPARGSARSLARSSGVLIG